MLRAAAVAVAVCSVVVATAAHGDATADGLSMSLPASWLDWTDSFRRAAVPPTAMREHLMESWAAYSRSISADVAALQRSAAYAATRFQLQHPNAARASGQAGDAADSARAVGPLAAHLAQRANATNAALEANAAFIVGAVASALDDAIECGAAGGVGCASGGANGDPFAPLDEGEGSATVEPVTLPGLGPCAFAREWAPQGGGGGKADSTYDAAAYKTIAEVLGQVAREHADCVQPAADEEDPRQHTERTLHEPVVTAALVTVDGWLRRWGCSADGGSPTAWEEFVVLVPGTGLGGLQFSLARAIVRRIRAATDGLPAACPSGGATAAARGSDWVAQVLERVRVVGTECSLPQLALWAYMYDTRHIVGAAPRGGGQEAAARHQRHVFHPQVAFTSNVIHGDERDQLMRCVWPPQWQQDDDAVSEAADAFAVMRIVAGDVFAPPPVALPPVDVLVTAYIIDAVPTDSGNASAPPPMEAVLERLAAALRSPSSIRRLEDGDGGDTMTTAVARWINAGPLHYHRDAVRPKLGADDLVAWLAAQPTLRVVGTPKLLEPSGYTRRVAWGAADTLEAATGWLHVHAHRPLFFVVDGIDAEGTDGSTV